MQIVLDNMMFVLRYDSVDHKLAIAVHKPTLSYFALFSRFSLSFNYFYINKHSKK